MIKVHAITTRKVDLQKAIEKAIERARGSSVDVGVMEGAGVYKQRGSQTPTVSQVALWNEAGTINMPARPFIRPAFKENQTAIDQECATCLHHMIFDNWSVERALSRLGLFVATLIQNKIKSNPEPILSGSWDDGPNGQGSGYLGRKRAAGQGQNRLIATGLLLRSVQFKVHLADSAAHEAEVALQDAIQTGRSRPTRRPQAMTRAQARAVAIIDKEANKMRRSANRKQFAAHSARIQQAQAEHSQVLGRHGPTDSAARQEARSQNQARNRDMMRSRGLDSKS